MSGFRGLSQIVEVWEGIGPTQRAHVRACEPSLSAVLVAAEEYMAQIEHEETVNLEEAPHE